MNLTELILATKNKDKVAELSVLLKPLGISVLSATDFPELPDVEEDGDTLEANALKKAKTIAQITGKATLADDSGLFVDALSGAPGVYSARYAGEQAVYQDNVNKLLSELQKNGSFPHTARFKTMIAFVNGDNHEFFFEGICEGQIIAEQRGSKGFGYDPVFIPDGFKETFAELTSEIKNSISHRAKAIQKFVLFIKEKTP